MNSRAKNEKSCSEPSSEQFALLHVLSCAVKVVSLIIFSVVEAETWIEQFPLVHHWPKSKRREEALSKTGKGGGEGEKESKRENRAEG